MRKKLSKIIGGAVTLATLTAGNVMAAVDLSGVDCDVAPVELLAATVLVGLGVMWGVRKLVKTINHS